MSSPKVRKWKRFSEAIKYFKPIIVLPKFYPQHGESYYALFFKDTEGIKYEIVFEEK